MTSQSTWTIKHIFDGEYGCEESQTNEPEVLVTLVNEQGEESYRRVSDKWLTQRNLDVGSPWPKEIATPISLN